jgi:recombination protein RecT
MQQANNSLAPRQGQAPATFSNFITGEGVRRKINEMVGGEGGQRFITSIISAVSNNPALAECDHGTILSSAMLGESLKLSPSPQLGQFYMVPFKDKKNKRTVATFVLGYKGYIQLAIRSGQYRKLNVLAIKEGELKHYDPLFEELEVELIQDDMIREQTPTIGYYAMFEYLNGFRKTMYWSKEKMEAHADKFSQAFNLQKYHDLPAGGVEALPYNERWKYSSFWYKDFDGMAYKTMLRQIISKWGIMSIEMQQAMAGDNAMMVNGVPQYIDADPIPPASSPEPEPQPEQQPTPEPDGQEEDDFFAGAEQSEPEQTQNTQSQAQAPTDEIGIAESVLDADALTAYKAANAAEKKKKALANVKAFGAQLTDAERLVGVSYAQWTTKHRAVLLDAYGKLQMGVDIAEVFPTQ